MFAEYVAVNKELASNFTEYNSFYACINGTAVMGDMQLYLVQWESDEVIYTTMMFIE